MSWADNKNYGEYSPSMVRRSKRKEKLAAIHAEENRQEAEAKAKAEKEYAAKQASVDTDITNASNGKGGSSSKGVSNPSGSPKDSLRIKRKNYSSMYSGAGRNLV